LLSIYVLATGVQGLQYMTGVQWLNDMFNGVALILAVAFAIWRQNAASRADRGPSSSEVTVGEDRAAPDSTPDRGASQNVP